MLFSIENARYSLPKLWLIASGFNMVATGLFLFPLFSGDVPTPHLLAWLAIAACVGLITGIYITFRSNCGTAFAFSCFFYALLTMQLMTVGGAAAGAMWAVGRLDLRWAAFYINGFIIIASMLLGMYREASSLGLWGAGSRDRWRSILEKHIDYEKHQVSPSITASALSIGKESENRSLVWITAGGVANICLLFELYGGGRNNVIFFAAALMVGVFVYTNIRHSGPGFVRLLLLRKIEKERGRRFVNADLEQIQELRRTFLLSRWLMKDYKFSQPVQTVQFKKK